MGLIATDGCLIESQKLVVVTSKDQAFLRQVREALGVGWIRGKRSGYGAFGHDLLIKQKALYERLVAIGLTPRKSLTLKPLAVPDEWFHDFLRGVIDGDGNIRRWIHPTNGREQWTVRIYGASHAFIEWLRVTIERLWRVRGLIHSREPKNEHHHTLHTLKYGKLAARVILAKCYIPGSIALARKQVLADACTSGWVGWSKSKTVLDRELWKGWKYQHIWASGSTKRTNPNVDPASGVVKESSGSWAGVSERQTIGA